MLLPSSDALDSITHQREPLACSMRVHRSGVYLRPLFLHTPVIDGRVCVCRHEMWISGFPEPSTVSTDPLSGLPLVSLGKIAYEGVVLACLALLEITIRAARFLGRNLMLAAGTAAVIYISKCRT